MKEPAIKGADWLRNVVGDLGGNRAENYENQVILHAFSLRKGAASEFTR